VPYAVELALDARSGGIVRDLWKDLSAHGVTWMADSGAEPHVSLAIWERIDRAPFAAEIARFAAETAPIPITLDAVSTFPGSAIYLRVAHDPRLVELQRRVHARFDALASEPWAYYMPDQWVPHCTLAMEIPPARLDDALVVARRAALPLAGRLEFVGLVEFRPVVTLARYRLGGS
jgi:2'-5' RNA ligase superfamily protein